MNGRKNNIYYQEKKIVFSDFDADGGIKISSLLSHTSVMAMEDYADRGCPWASLVSRGIMFLVAGVNLRLHKNIQENEIITAATYERGIKGAACLRDYFFLNGKGEKVMSAASAWIVCDIEKRRILRPDTDRLPWRLGENPKVVDCDDYSRIHIPEGMEPAGTRKVRYSDLDLNGHVNNSVYSGMAADVLPREIFKKGYTGVSVTYHSEASLGDILELSRFVGASRAVVRGKKDGRLCFDMEITGDF
jgi:medium-chain acyl-[acyl-carrier-protein] hydrolase